MIANKGYRHYPPGGSGFVTVKDVVRAMTMLMDSKIKNERFILISENLTYQKILMLITKNLGPKTPSIPLRAWQLEGLRIMDWLAHAVTGKTRKLTKKAFAR